MAYCQAVDYQRIVFCDILYSNLRHFMPSLLVNLIIFLVVCFIVNSHNARQTDKNKVLVWCAIIQVLFFQTFKDVNTLPDIPGYVDAYRYICREDATYWGATGYYKMQYGYYFYNKLLSIISSNPYYFTFATGCLITLPYIFFIKKYSPIVWFSLALYLMSFVQSTMALRQYTAIGLCIISFPLLFKCKYVWCGLLWLAAMAIHPTAVFFGLIYVLYFIRSRKLLIAFYLLLFLMLYKFIPMLMAVFVGNVAGYNVYLESSSVEFSTFLINAFIFGMAWFFLIRGGTVDEETLLMVKMLGVTTIVPLAATFSNTSDIVPRLILYFTFVQFAVIAKTLVSIKIGIIRSVAYILYAFIFFYQFYISDNSRIFEFKLIFE